MSTKYFDHILGTQFDDTSEQDVKLTKRILDAMIQEQPIEELRKNQHIGVKLEMNDYLLSDTKKITRTGDFLFRLFNIYNINKTKFAEHIGYESANLHALLKGRRKFNSNLASKIGEIFNIDPEIWLFIEAKNELKEFHTNKTRKLKNVSLKQLSHDR